MSTQQSTNTFDRAREIAPTCSITPDATEQQKERQRRLAPATESIVRTDDSVEIQFNERLERETLDAMIAVENDCCPFLTFTFDDNNHKLRVGVNNPDHTPALDAIAQALQGDTTTRT